MAAPQAQAAPRAFWLEEQRFKLVEMYVPRAKIIEGALSYKPGEVLTKQMKNDAWQEISDAVSAIGHPWSVAQCKTRMTKEKSDVRVKHH